MSGVSGHTYDMLFDLIFTNERVIVIPVSHPNDTFALESSLFLRSLFVGNWMRRSPRRQTRTAQSLREAIKDQSPDEIVAKNPRSFIMRHDDILAVEISRHWLQTRLRFYLSQPAGGIVQDFTLPSQKVPYARQLLEQVLKSKIKQK